MTVSYNATLKTTRMTAVKSAIEAGAGAPVLEIYNAGYALLLTSIALADPDAVTVDGDHLDFNGCPRSDSDADNSGTAAVARIKDGDGNIVVTNLTVGVGGGFDVQINSVSIVQHQMVTLNSGVITHSA